MKTATLMNSSLCDDGVHLRTAEGGEATGGPTAVAASRRPPPSSTITKTKKVAAVAAVIERERGGRGERGGLDRRRRSRPTAAASTLAPYDGDRATAVTRETTAAAAAAAAVGSLEDPDAAGAGHSFPVGTMSSKDARHPSLSLSLSSLFALSSVSLHLPSGDCQSQSCTSLRPTGRRHGVDLSSLHFMFITLLGSLLFRLQN